VHIDPVGGGFTPTVVLQENPGPRRLWHPPGVALTRAAGCLASAFHARATTATIRAQLITVPARLARSARRLRLHLPQHWPWEPAWTQLFDATLGPPRTA